MATNVQELIQGLAPVTANNGNPNTVYNTPASPFANPTAGMPANWVLGNLPSYKPLDWQKLAAQAPQPLDGFKGFGIHSDAPNTWPGIQPPPTPTTNPPPTGGNTPPPNVNTGGPDLPRRNPNLGGGEGGNGGQWWRNPNDPRLSGLGGSGTGINFLDPDMRRMFENSFQAQDPGGSVRGSDLIAALRNDGSMMDIPLGTFGQQLHNTTLGRKLGITEDGTINAAQILDLFVKGNFYMSQTGKFNWANLIPTATSALLGPLAGLLVGNWMDKQGAQWENYTDAQIDQSLKDKPLAKLRAWWRRLVRDRYKMNKENRNKGRNTNTRSGGDRGGRANTPGTQGGYFGGSWGWGGGMPGGSVTIGGTGPGEISDSSGSGSGSVYYKIKNF